MGRPRLLVGVTEVIGKWEAVEELLVENLQEEVERCDSSVCWKLRSFAGAAALWEAPDNVLGWASEEEKAEEEEEEVVEAVEEVVSKLSAL